MRDNPLLALLAVFVPLSFLTIGGGQSITADMHRQAVEVRGWMTDGDFLDLFALSRLAPGPGSLLVSLVGYKVAGWAGAIVASLAIFLPSSLLVYALARLWTRHHGARWVRAAEAGLAPVAAGMILAASLTLLSAAEGGPLAWVVALTTLVILLNTRVSPFILLPVGAGVFLAFG